MKRRSFLKGLGALTGALGVPIISKSQTPPTASEEAKLRERITELEAALSQKDAGQGGEVVETIEGRPTPLPSICKPGVFILRSTNKEADRILRNIQITEGTITEDVEEVTLYRGGDKRFPAFKMPGQATSHAKLRGVYTTLMEHHPGMVCYDPEATVRLYVSQDKDRWTCYTGFLQRIDVRFDGELQREGYSSRPYTLLDMKLIINSMETFAGDAPWVP